MYWFQCPFLNVYLFLISFQNAEITYYQWTPLILLFLAFLFKFPNILWKLLNTHTGFNFHCAETIAFSAMENKKGEDYDDAIKSLARFIDTWIRAHRYYELNLFRTIRAKMSHILCMYCNKREGKYLSALYINIKALYVVNVISQFYILKAFLGMDFSSYGYEVMNGLSSGENWVESPRFPRITLCDFEIRQLQNVQRYVELTFSRHHIKYNIQIAGIRSARWLFRKDVIL